MNNTDSKGRFIKGMIPWNKGTVGVMKANKASFKKGEHRSVKTEFTRERVLGEKNNKWKGDNVGYGGLHTWVKRTLDKASVCTKCESTKYVEWANKSYEYKRDINDWIQLCAKCHDRYDRKNGWGIATRKFNL